MNKRKLYKATVEFDVLFADNIDKNKFNLYSEKLKYLKLLASGHILNEITNYGSTPDKIKNIIEVTCIEHIPDNWLEIPYYGDNPDNECAVHFIADKDPEYNEYLRLKKKFERIKNDE